MAYTTIKKPSDYFNTVTWTGNATDDRSITGVGFKPDWVWYKERSNVGDHTVHDIVRGAGERLFPNDTSVESLDANSLQAFESDGFQIGTNADVNGNNETYVGWNWLADNTSGSANTDGTISSTVSANTTSGFSIVSYTGNGTSGATVGHGLGVKPSMMIIKTRESLGNWITYHVTQGATKYLELNGDGAVGTSTAAFNDTEPTSSVFTLGTWSNTNDSGNDMIAYCFAEKQGYSKFGSYTGNGSATNSPFVYTGFKPAFILFKNTTAEKWLLMDNKRNTFNVSTKGLIPDSNQAEENNSLFNMDFLSNGFKPYTSWNGINASGSTYIYMAFAEEPLVGDNPATAR